MNANCCRRLFLSILLLASTSLFALAQASGSLIGTVKHLDTREGIPSVNVRLKGTTLGAATDEKGSYRVANIPPGRHTIVISAIGHQSVEASVEIPAGQDYKQDFFLKDEAVKMSDVYVLGASLRRERITEAPASVSVMSAKDIARNAGSGQLAKLLESEPGVDLAQSGLYDFNINTRGFNSSLNRRLLILLDGRDQGTAFLGATEWNGLSIPLEEIGRIELVRGPGSALYGANAYNGVLNITSIAPKSAPGTRAIIGAGELSMFRGDVKHADILGPWSYRLNLGAISGKTFSKNRNGLTVDQFEYQGFQTGLNNEFFDLDLSPVRSTYASARLDYEYESGGSATIEGGMAQVENEVIVTGIGRVQAKKAQRPWARANYRGHGFNVLLWMNGRINKQPDFSLSTGLPLTQDATMTQGELQYSFDLADGDLFIVTGVSHRLVNIDTKGTLMQASRNDNMSGVFGQAEYKFADNLKTVVAARWDRSSLHPSQFSPKAAIVWALSGGHTLRATFNQAFQSPNYSELYLRVKHPLRNVIYYGNPLLVQEKITGYEIGYAGIFENSIFLTVDVYFNHLKDFVTDLAPGVNPAYPGPIIVDNEPFSRQVWSYTNAGEVNEAGCEIAVNYYMSDSWVLDANISYFTFDVLSQNVSDVLLPNSPRYRLNAGMTYNNPSGFDVGLKMKHVPSFPWAAGIYKGDIKEYTLINLSGSYRITEKIALNKTVSNLLDNQHYEIFGGSLLARRAVSTLTMSF